MGDPCERAVAGPAATDLLVEPVRQMRQRAIPIVLAAAAYALAILQRPGVLIADTKLDLYVSPRNFLADVASAWTPTNGLGHVWGGQYGGYLFPMGPFFALGDLSGLPMWLVHRLWLGTLFALAAWGVVRLLDALLDRRRGAPHAVAAALYVLNPYVAIYANRTSVALLAYAALPWMLLAVHRGLRDPRGWWWPAAFALVLTSTGGGVNAAVTGWVLLAPALLVAYELGWGGVAWRDVRGWLWRMVVVNAVASAWWVVPLLVHSAHGLDFLPFTEQPGTIWGTTSLPESLRLGGFWTGYIGVGYGGLLRPFSSSAPGLLFNPVVVTAGLVVPGAALLAAAWTWRGRYVPFLLAMTLVALLAMVAGFPEGTPLRKALTFTYNHVQALQFLRTTYKVGPLVALGLACLAGLGFAVAWGSLGGSRALRAALVAAVATVAAVAAWPLTSGRAPEAQLAFEVPPAYRTVAHELDRAPDGERAMVLPGQLFAFARWGGTIDALLPALTSYPIAERYIVPFSDLRAQGLQWATDAIVSQERALPGELTPLLDLMGVGTVVTASDGDRARSGEVGAAEGARQLATALPGTTPRGVGPLRTVRPASGRLDASVRLPELSVRRTRTAGIVRVVGRDAPTVVDGAADGVVALAAFGALRPDQALGYAPDLDPAALRATARDGGTFVVADGNRRRAFVSSRLRGGTGRTLPAAQDVSADGTMLNPFPAAGPDAQTVAVQRGVASLSAPFSPQVTQFPARRPAAAMDGDLGTAWVADRTLGPDRHHLDLDFGRPRDVPFVRLYPYSDPRGVVRAVSVNGRRFRVHQGWNRLAVGLRGVRGLSIAMSDVGIPASRSAGAGGIRELQVPGVRVRELLRPPVVLERALRGVPLGASTLEYLLERTSADAPARQGRYADTAQASLLRDARDPELRLARQLSPPAARDWSARAWVSVDPRTPDDALDRLAGTAAGLRATSSSRFEGRPRNRASGAFDGTRSRGWIGQWLRGHPVHLSWEAHAPATVRELQLVPPAVRVRRPTRVRLSVDGRDAGGPLTVGAAGRVRLPAPATGRRFRLDVLAARFASGTPARDRARRAVGIAELRGTGVPRVAVRRGGRLKAACGAAGVATRSAGGIGGAIGLQTDADLARFDAGLPLRARACGAPVALPAGRLDVTDAGGPLRLDRVQLVSAAPAPRVAMPAPAGRVLSEGTGGRGKRDGVRLAVGRPAWLVYGESFERGWRATCDGRDLGAPTPLMAFANAWRIPAGCTRASFVWAPNAILRPAYAISALGCLLLLTLLVLRRRRGPLPRRLPALAWDGEFGRWGWRRALVAGLLAAPVLGFVFALRAGVVLGPLVALVLWRGLSVRRLVQVAGAVLVVAVPVAYLLTPEADPGGYDTAYAVQRIAAHWLAVGALTLLLVALVQVLARSRVRRA